MPAGTYRYPPAKIPHIFCYICLQKPMRPKSRDQTLYAVLMLCCILGFWWFENFYTPATYSTSERVAVPGHFPVTMMPESTTGSVVRHAHYMLSYHETYEQAEWVAYALDKSHLTYDDRERPYFIEDPGVKSKSADWRNYRGSGYERGHLCPAGDRRFSEAAYNETFYTSNISPQKADFNAGIWNRLEQQVRSWGKRYGRVYVITGGILETGLAVIGDEEVAIPGAYYKIVARGDTGNPAILAFLIPHRETAASLDQFLVSVDSLEARTNINFFKALPEAIQTRVEERISREDWSW